MSRQYPEWAVHKEVRVNCKDCTAECCKHIAIEIDAPKTHEDFQEIIGFCAYENVSVYKDSEGDWMVEFKTRCSQLDANRCLAFKENKQPMTCREYKVDSCVMNAPGEYWEVLFDRPRQAAMYAKRKGVRQHLVLEREKDCEQTCCNHLALTIDPPETWRDYDDIRWYVAHRNVTVYKDGDGDWLVEFATPPEERCKKCDADGCREEHTDYEILFETMDDVDAYLAEQNIHPPAKLTLTGF